MAVENSSIFLGSGATMTLVPELDFFFKAETTSTTAIQIETTNAVQFQLVPNLYVGCTLDWYDNGVYASSHTITANDHDTFTITPATSAAVVTAADEFVLRAYGAPCPAPDSDNDGTGKTRLHADNWLGLIETATFPNIEVEMKQLNLSLGGTRNFTHQYKGIETASGGNLALVCNQVTWLYYALGKCTELTVANAVTSEHPASYHVGTHGGMYFHNTNASSHIDEGPFIYRANSVSGGTHLVPPLLFTVDDTIADLDAIPTNNGHIVATGGFITYKFAETNGSHLPSFALEYSLAKDVTNTIQADQDSDAEDLNFVRIARGNRVNTLTMTANENEEVKMTMDLNTRTITPVPQTLASPSTGYESRGGQTVNNDLFNFTNEPTHLEPFFFSDGTMSVFGQQFLKITNFTLTINNNLQDKRFLGAGNKSIKEGIPAQRTYEIALTALVTDDKLFTELLNQVENDGDGNDGSEDYESLLSLSFTKDSGEAFAISFRDYFVSANTWTVPEDKGAITVEATIMPRTLHSCTTTTHWVLQG
tara:strand:+ start:7832 stop:9439 length:1608 start_codon:yes stop_codon:yes gene_type:complete